MPETAPHTGLPAKDPIYQSAYHYRRAEFLVLSVLLLGVFLPAFVRFAWQCTGAGRPLDETLLLVVPTAIFGAFALIGGILLHHFLKHHTKPLVIDETGVLYGRKHLAWADIGSLRGERVGKGRSGNLQLVLRKRDRWFSGSPLTTTPGLTPHDHYWLMDRLQHEIAPFHAHLKFTGP